MIEKKLNGRCSNRASFAKHKEFYESALKNSGYKTRLTFTEKTPTTQAPRKPRYKQIFWFNPPFNLKTRTNIGREFLRLVDKNFPRGTQWHKHFNRHTVKISYSCTRNIARIISAHNQKITNTERNQEPGCNCTTGPCPVDGKCLTTGLVYTGTMSHKRKNYTYCGSTGNTFKERYSNHKQDLKNQSRAGTTLSSKFWELTTEDPSDIPTIEWKIVNRCHTLKAGMPICDVCLTEKTRLLLGHEAPEPKPPPNTIFLNKRNEIYAKCRHRRKFTLQQCGNLYK